jgi:pimeloyl-ACP methyl ester carboxylesterase
MIEGSIDREIDVRAIRFHVLEWGSSVQPPMVLLHGLTGHAHTWDHMAKDLATEYHVFAPDQRGHGDTAHAASYATQDFVDDLEALREEWRLERFVLMGLSMGGHNAMAYALAHPQSVSRLVVIDIPPRLNREAWLEGPQGSTVRRVAEQGHRPFASVDDAFAEARKGNATAPDDNLRYRTELNLRPTEGGLMLKWDPRVQVLWAPDDLRQRLPELTMPVLLVRGGKTNVLASETAVAMVASIPDAELLEISSSGHSVPTDRPEELTPHVLAWLQRRAD